MSLNPRITSWAGRTVWLVGASTGIGRATASLLHGKGARVVVSARSAAVLDAFVATHPGSVALALDATDRAAMQAAAERIVHTHGRIDLALYCAGTYRAMRATAFDFDVAQQHVQVNYVGALVMLDAVLPVVLRQARQAAQTKGSPWGAGHISLVSSVAGYRGLPQSLAYGPTKAALINLAETLHMDLQPQGIAVSVVNPGFVETPLTAKNNFHMPALTTPQDAAKAMVQGWERGLFEIHFPKRFTLWLKGLRLLGYGAYFAAVRRSTRL
jgi:NAD(P)-dependent dehydrogenase (short-subunit alcohol dehydrogenase family)